MIPDRVNMLFTYRWMGAWMDEGRKGGNEGRRKGGMGYTDW